MAHKPTSATQAPAAQAPAAQAIVDEVCRDERVRAEKEKVLSRQWWQSAMYSVSDTFKFLAAVTIPVAMMVAKNAMDKAPQAGAAVAESAMSVGLSAAAPMLAAATAFTAIAISSQFFASRTSHAASFDALELNAQHTAKYLVKELKKEASCVAPAQEYEHHARNDGKSWQQVVAARQAAQAQDMGASRV